MGCASWRGLLSRGDSRSGDHSGSGANRTNAVVLRFTMAERICLPEPCIHVICERDNGSVRLCFGATHWQFELPLIALDCTYTASDIGSNFLPRSQDPRFHFVLTIFHVC